MIYEQQDQSLKYKHNPTVPMKSMWSGGANNRNNE